MKPLPKFDPNTSSEALKDQGDMELANINKELCMESQQTTETEPQATRRPRTRIGHDRSRLVRALEALATATGAPFDPPTLTQLAGISDDEYRAICARLIESIGAGISGIGKATIPTIDSQIANFEAWQRQRPQYFWWSDAEMENLRQKLTELGQVETSPIFAMSIAVKLLPSGKIVLIDRNGKETKS